ncbi:hypothetical protein K438DRAFT_1762026 [Mycena galopus ATCC 62051]|nr:hypothetical protein K438DRAFT_1762026 [Mycena galopus ATCC 62051]
MIQYGKFPGDVVRNLLIQVDGDRASLLSVCGKTENLWINADLGPNLFPQISVLPLKRLTCNLTVLFGPDRPWDFTHQLFSRLTHLEILDSMVFNPSDTDIDPKLLLNLVLIPHLSHLAFAHVDDFHDVGFIDFFLPLLSTCKSLRVLVVFDPYVHTIIPHHQDKEQLAQDQRFVILECKLHTENWILGAHTGIDYWSRADDFVAKRRSGEIDVLTGFQLAVFYGDSLPKISSYLSAIYSKQGEQKFSAWNHLPLVELKFVAKVANKATVTHFVTITHLNHHLMHEDLQLKNFAKLPLLYRVYVSNAANGSLSDFRKLHALVLKGPPDRKELLLPVYYRNLDITGIPTPDQLDCESVAQYASASSAIERAALALQELSWCTEWWGNGIPEELGPDLWPRIWNWIKFLDEYRDSVQGIMPLSAKDTYAGYAKIIHNFQLHKNTMAQVHDTPGVRLVMARAWVLIALVALILRSERGIHERCFVSIVRFLDEDPLSAQPKNMQEYVEGAGGTVDEFAALVMEHVERTQAPPDDGGYPTGESSAFFLWGLLDLLVEGDDGHGPLNRALLNRGIVGAVTHLLSIYPGGDSGAKDSIRYLLQTVLPRSLVSHSVLSVIQASPPPANALFDNPKPLRDPQLFAAWQTFNEMAAANNQVFQEYNLGGYKSIRACDNMKFRFQCGRLCRRKEIKRYPGLFTDRERYFLNALIHHGYETRLKLICMQTVAFMHTHPGEELYLVLDYTKAPHMVELRTVSAASPDPNPSDGSAAQWEDQLARAAHSGGRMELVVVLVGNGRQTYQYMVPIRRRTSELHDGLQRIAAGIPAGADSGPEVEQQVEYLLKDHRESGDDRIEWNFNAN